MMEALESLVVDHAADAQFRKPDIGDEIGAGWLIAVARRQFAVGHYVGNLSVSVVETNFLKLLTLGNLIIHGDFADA